MQWMPKWLVFHKSWNGQWNFFFQSKSVKSWLNILHIVEFQKKINECGTLLHTYYIRDSQGLEWYVQPKVPNKIRSFGSHRIHIMVFAYVLFTILVLLPTSLSCYCHCHKWYYSYGTLLHSAVEYFIKRISDVVIKGIWMCLTVLLD